MLKETTQEILFRTGAISAARAALSALDGFLKQRGLLPALHRGGLIFMFHAVAERPSPFRLAISREAFEEFCKFVSESYETLPLSDMESRRRANKLGARSISITFDDGFKDNHDVVLPLLKRYGLPATVFVTTGAVGGEHLLWFHRLAYIFEAATPKELPVCVGPFTFPLDTEHERAMALHRVARDLKRRSSTEREELISALAEAFGVTDFSKLKGEMLTWEELRRMDSEGFSVEAHTVSHPILAREPLKNAAREIALSREILREELRRPIDFFAYPNGKREDITEDVVRAVEEAGFRAAFTSEFSAATPSNDPYRVPRVSLYSTSSASLVTQIERCFYDV